MTGDLSAFPLTSAQALPAPDLIPLLPRGDTVFEDLPARALILDALAPAIGDGLIVVRRSPGVGVLLIRSGRIAEAYAVEPEHRAVSDDAIARMGGWGDAVVSAWRLSPEVIDVLPPLVRGNPVYAELRLEWVIWERLLADLRSRPGTYIIEVTTPAGRGVTSIRGGTQVATYTDQHRNLGDGSLVDELATAATGTIRVLQDVPRATVHDLPAPAAAPRAEHIEHAPHDGEHFTNIFGVPRAQAAPASLVPIGPSAPTVAQLLPELKRLVQERLHQSSLRLEILLEDAAANNASLDAVVAEVRATPIRGVMQSTLDELADEMLALGQG